MNQEIFSGSINARCELAMSKILREVDPEAADDHRDVAYGTMCHLGRLAFELELSLVPSELIADEKILLQGWTNGIKDAQTDLAIHEAGLG